MGLLVAPSLLAADASRLADEVARAEEAGADLLHLDIMDNHFVPNLTFGPHICAAVKRVATRPVVAHLMVDGPEGVVESFIGLLHLTWTSLEAQHDLRRKFGFDSNRFMAQVAESLGQKRSVQEILQACVGGQTAGAKSEAGG